MLDVIIHICDFGFLSQVLGNQLMRFTQKSQSFHRGSLLLTFIYLTNILVFHMEDFLNNHGTEFDIGNLFCRMYITPISIDIFSDDFDKLTYLFQAYDQIRFLTDCTNRFTNRIQCILSRKSGNALIFHSRFNGSFIHWQHLFHKSGIVLVV